MIHEEISIKILAADGGACNSCIIQQKKTIRPAEFGLIISDDRDVIRFENHNLCDTCTVMTIIIALMQGVQNL